ncbi:hypothetical protein ES703_110257 [subsurface metagenome]
MTIKHLKHVSAVAETKRLIFLMLLARARGKLALATLARVPVEEVGGEI